MTIHWCGTGLSSVPGLRRLIVESGQPVTVWNRTVEKARAEVGDLTNDIRAYSLDALRDALQPGDALLVAGKGHESGQIIMGEVYPFDDVEQASVAVAALDGVI